MPATYEPIATTTLGSAAASITFSSITSAYTDLRIVLVGLLDTGTFSYVSLRLNGDTGTNYSTTYIQGTGSVAQTNRYTSQTSIFFTGNLSLSTTIPILYEIDLFSYANSTNKTILSRGSGDKNGSGIVDRAVGLWRNTATVNSLTLLSSANNFATGTTATLYGILKA